MKSTKPLIDASNLKDLTFARGVVDLINGVNSDDAEFVRALTNPDEGTFQDLPPHGRVQ